MLQTSSALSIIIITVTTPSHRVGQEGIITIWPNKNNYGIYLAKYKQNMNSCSDVKFFTDVVPCRVNRFMQET